MTLLDRFRTQTRHKHPDPAVRLAFVAELPLDDRETIAAIAREDEDPRVRRAAVAQVDGCRRRSAPSPATMRTRACARAALEMLRDLALEAFEGTAEADSLDAVDAIADARMLAQVAKTARPRDSSRCARCRARATRTRSARSRGTRREAVRRAAFERLRERAEHAEILAVAMNSEFKDTGLAAVDVIDGSRASSSRYRPAAGTRRRPSARAASCARGEERAAREQAASRRRRRPWRPPTASRLAEDMSVV